MLPIIATKGGRGNKGKLLACPTYKTMNIQTAYDLSAHLHGGRELQFPENTRIFEGYK